MFVNSHIEKLRKGKGEKAIAELEKRMGRPLNFSRFEEVPVRDESDIIEHVLDLTEAHGLTGPARARAAGRLHYTTFAETTFGGTLFRSLPHTTGSFRTLLFNIGSISRSVFKHMEFRTEERDPNIVIYVENCHYPPEHFQGFFEAWIAAWELGDYPVDLKIKSPNSYEYTIAI